MEPQITTAIFFCRHTQLFQKFSNAGRKPDFLVCIQGSSSKKITIFFLLICGAIRAVKASNACSQLWKINGNTTSGKYFLSTRLKFSSCCCSVPLWRPVISIRNLDPNICLTWKVLPTRRRPALIHLIPGDLEPQTRSIYRADSRSVFIDQDYLLLDNELKVEEQAHRFNTSALREHEIKIRLNRFLFTKED